MKTKEKINNILDSIIILEILDKKSDIESKLQAEKIIEIAKKEYKRDITKKRIIDVIAYLREEIEYKVFQYPDGYVKREEKLDAEFFNSLITRSIKTTCAKADSLDNIIKNLKKLDKEIDFIDKEVLKIEKQNASSYNKDNLCKIYSSIKEKNKISIKYKTQSIIKPFETYKVTPLYIISSNKIEYLIALEDNVDSYKYLKLSKIYEVKELSEKVREDIMTVSADSFIDSNRNKFNLVKEEIIFTFEKEKLDYIIETFNNNIEVLPMNSSKYIANIYENKEVAKTSLLEIIDEVEVLKPSNLTMEMEYLLWEIAERGDIQC